MNDLELDRTQQEREELVKSWIKSNWYYALGILVASIAIIYGINNYNKQKEDKLLHLGSQFEQFDVLVSENKLDQALAIAKSIQTEAPKSTFASLAGLSLGKAFFDINDYEKSISAYDWILNNSKDSSIKDIAILRKAKVLSDNSQTELAIKLIDSISNQILTAEIEELKGDIFMRNAQYENAKKAYLLAKGSLSNPVIDNKLALIDTLAQ